MLTIEIKSGNIKEYLENMKTYFIKNSNKISNIFRRRGKKKEHKNMNKITNFFIAKKRAKKTKKIQKIC